MESVPTRDAVVKQPMALRQYADDLRTFTATVTTAHGTVDGMVRELYTHGGQWLEWRATGYYERTLIRRTDPRLSLREARA